MIYVAILPNTSFTAEVARATDPANFRVISRTDATVAGARAVKVEVERNAARAYAYIIERPAGTLFLVADSGAQGDFNQGKAVTDAMAASMRFAAGGLWLDQVCRSSRFGFEVDFPGNWHTAPVGNFSCLYFDPRKEAVDPESPVEPIVRVLVSNNTTFAKEVADGTSAAQGAVSNRVDGTLGGVAMVRFDLEGRPGSNAPEGVRFHVYIFDRPGGPLVLMASSRAEGNYAQASAVVDAMAASIRFQQR
jgi:hypothetical protein